MSRFRPRLTYANVISTLCLFLALGGGAWAAAGGPAKNSVGTRQLKDEAVTAAKVKKHSLTGADIKSSTLGTVPKAASAGSAASAGHATTADSAVHADSATEAGHATSAAAATTAGDATTLGGLAPGALYPAGGAQRIVANPVYHAAAETVYAADGMTLVADCDEGGIAGSSLVALYATATAPGARAVASYVERANSTTRPVLKEFALGSSLQPVWSSFTGSGGPPGQSVGTLDYSDSSHSIEFTLQSGVNASHECQVSGVAVVNG